MTEDALAGMVRAFFAGAQPDRLGVAVSGGGDSTALLVLLDDWRRGGGSDLHAVTVDHGLRPEAAEEAAAVGQLCRRLGIPHDILSWRWDGQGNLSDAARRGRMAAIGGWAGARGIGIVALGHTLDDQAETFLMRLARGSGVDGLAAMAARRRSGGVDWVRPLLHARRAALRDVLAARGIGWADDPTNDDPAYDRARARAALSALGPLGLTPETLVATANWMTLAREVLDRAALGLAREAVAEDRGDLLLRRAPFEEAPLETQLRVLAGALMWVSGAEYRPRLDSLTGLYGRLRGKGRQTLAGCLISAEDGRVRIAREYRAVRDREAAPGQVWDGRWLLAAPPGVDTGGLVVRALGEGALTLCPDWRASGLPRTSLAASPAVWRDGALVAAPLAGLGEGWTAGSSPDRPDFFTSLVTH